MSNDPQLHRKLAAIVAADVVGYSRMMEADEVGTLRQVQSVQKTCITPITAAYGGRLIKTTGDGFLFEFVSAVDAILFALDFQKKVRAAMTAVSDDRRLVFRVGVHAGDVLSDGNDMFGDGVNVAARLETLCAPGGICMSAVVQQQLHGKIELPLVDLGEHQVKNITRAIHVFGIEANTIDTINATPSLAGFANGLARPRSRQWLGLGALGVVLVILAGLALHQFWDLKSTDAEQTSRAFSIAVLPFKTLNSDGKADDFADALVDNLTTELSTGFPASSVVSTASTFTYRGKSIDPRQVGRELGVKYLLTGTVQRFSERLRVNVQLVESASDTQLWSDTFDGSLADIAVLQDQITSGIANTLSVQIVRIEADRQKYSANTTTLDLVFRGAATLNRESTRESFAAAEADFRRALALDPNNLMAMKMLGQLLILESTFSLYNQDDKVRAKFAEGQDLLERVRSEDQRYPGLNSALGYAALISDKRQEAIDHFKMEIEIDPNATSALSGLALCLIGNGLAKDAVPLIEKSMRLDPHSTNMAGYQQTLMLAYFALGDDKAAIEQGEHAYNANPKAPDILFYLASAYAWAGDDADAKARLADALKLDPHRTVGLMRREMVAKEPAEIALATRYIEGLRRAGLPP